MTVLVEAYAASGLPFPNADIITNPTLCRSVLTWITRIPSPVEYYPYTPEIEHQQAAGNSPGHGASGTENWVWRGMLYHALCPPLGGRVLVNMGQAMPPDEPFSLTLLLDSWRELAKTFLEHPIPGEGKDARY